MAGLGDNNQTWTQAWGVLLADSSQVPLLRPGIRLGTCHILPESLRGNNEPFTASKRLKDAVVMRSMEKELEQRYINLGMGHWPSLDPGGDVLYCASVLALIARTASRLGMKECVYLRMLERLFV
ncbi:hypothetical protein NDU88_001060 [Pleurodeles waltl]|uniref:Uncharacterized protein n=1 Tax=Pleurodeles waltl TaxID=8319 RepID=A0AAV7P609_PLEWA|nr:hypothetical protein NDU88_001060 [Pleurodeles waltl]